MQVLGRVATMRASPRKIFVNDGAELAIVCSTAGHTNPARRSSSSAPQSPWRTPTPRASTAGYGTSAWSSTCFCRCPIRPYDRAGRVSYNSTRPHNAFADRTSDDFIKELRETTAP